MVHRQLILSYDTLNSETVSQGKFFWVCVLVTIVVFYCCFFLLCCIATHLSVHLPSRSTKGSLSLDFMPVMCTNMVLKETDLKKTIDKRIGAGGAFHPSNCWRL